MQRQEVHPSEISPRRSPSLTGRVLDTETPKRAIKAETSSWKSQREKKKKKSKSQKSAPDRIPHSGFFFGVPRVTGSHPLCVLASTAPVGWTLVPRSNVSLAKPTAQVTFDCACSSGTAPGPNLNNLFFSRHHSRIIFLVCVRKPASGTRRAKSSRRSVLQPIPIWLHVNFIPSLDARETESERARERKVLAACLPACRSPSKSTCVLRIATSAAARPPGATHRPRGPHQRTKRRCTHHIHSVRFLTHPQPCFYLHIDVSLSKICAFSVHHKRSVTHARDRPPVFEYKNTTRPRRPFFSYHHLRTTYVRLSTIANRKLSTTYLRLQPRPKRRWNPCL